MCDHISNLTSPIDIKIIVDLSFKRRVSHKWAYRICVHGMDRSNYFWEKVCFKSKHILHHLLKECILKINTPVFKKLEFEAILNAWCVWKLVTFSQQ